MGKLVKVILMIFSSVALLIVAAAIIIPLVVDVNDYKWEMEVAARERTGRTLKIEGDLDLSVFPWLGVSTGKILLGNAPGFAEKPFAVIGKADIKVKLLPLFSKKVEVSTIVLKDLEVHLEKNKQGVSNWYDLTAKPAEDQSVASEQQTGDSDSGLAAIEIGGLVVENSKVSWDDQQSGQHIVVKDFNFSSGAVVFNEPIAIKIAFLLENKDPAITEQLSLSTSLVIDETFQKIQLNNFQLDSVTKGESIPGGVFSAQLLSAIAVDLEAQTLALKNLHINSDTIKLTGNISTTQLQTDPHYAGALQIEPFSPKSLMQQLAMSIPETTDKNVLQKLAMSFDLQGTKDSVALEKLTTTLDDTHINGYTHIKQFNQPAITFQLAIDDIDVDRYSAPKQEPEPGKTPVAKVKAAISEATLLPMDTLRTLNINGDLQIAKLKAAKLKMEGVNLNIQAKQGILKTQQTVKRLYQGNYQGRITINAQGKSPSISLHEKMTRVQLEPLLNALQPDSKAKLKGLANITANLNTTGNTMTAIKSGLDGTLNFSLDNGAVRGFNLQKIIDVGRLAIKGKEMQQNYADEQTLFTVIKGTATIKKGLINNPDFFAESSTIEVSGEGTANLVNEALDYKVVAKAKKGGKNVANRPVALKVQGTFSEPSYTVDLSSIESMMTEEEKQKVDKFIDKREKDIDKALGEGTGKAVNKLLKGFF
ncbi:hypothetical protein AU255_18370 [Methyloprofundus sedimenti]|uniref:AsmA domain-containing protein n=1 Tax=Methyloprofundus sedimenti TaxID=1420851 RepID=A0A1V8M1J7_9GAMM|nr:AsmA family protein [Methyloprofundus sedimenti]OQK15434.1 hypothetical protein AU255_18370 [Methyloprofundus sedimenti]